MRDRIHALVVDDEAPARARLVDLLGREDPRIAVTEAADGHTAVRLLRAPSPPDLVFLDVQMPEVTGLDVVRAIGASGMPMVIFVTAFDQHAVAAFEAHAVDYLLKPFSDERFEVALARARTRLAERSAARGMARLITDLAAADAPEPIRVLLVRSAGLIRLVRAAEIERIEGAGPYVELHAGPERLLHRASLTELAERLDRAQFVRVHRSTIVNIEHVVRLEARPHGEFDAVLRSGSHCRVSRTCRPLLERHLGQSL